MTGILTFLVVSYLALIILGIFSDYLIFQPFPSSYTDAGLELSAKRLGIADVRVLHLQSVVSDKKPESITAVYLPNPDARYTLLFSHGNAEDLGDDLPQLDAFRRAGFSVFAYDYRGYGTSTGRPTESGAYADAEAAYKYLPGELHVPPEQIIVMGRSLGAAAALQLATSHPSAGLILESPFLTAFKVISRVKLLPFDKFDNESRIRNYRGPLLVIQGQADRLVPPSHGRRIYELATGPKQSLWVPGAGHNDVFLTAPQDYLHALRTFAASLPHPGTDH
jgi:hypothetical protein